VAFINCPVCKNSVSNLARNCPTCGVRINTRTNGLTYALLGLIAVIAFIYFDRSTSLLSPRVENQERANTSAPTTPANNRVIASSDNTYGWAYRQGKDKLGVITQNALVMSDNSIEIIYPNRAITYLAIQLRKHPQNGTDVILRINNGQLDCTAKNCKVSVVFNMGSPTVFVGYQPNNQSNDLIYLNDAKGFIAELKKYQKAFVEVSFYNSGKHTFVFNVENLDFD
jgi:hypothetical protein